MDETAYSLPIPRYRAELTEGGDPVGTARGPGEAWLRSRAGNYFDERTAR